MPHHNERRRGNLLGAAAVTAVTLGTAIGGSRSGDFCSAWYQQLRKPVGQPSGAVIGTVWSILYTLTAVSAGLLWWRREKVHGNRLWAVFALQYALNYAFTPLFTRLHALRLATLDCALLTLVVAILAVLAWPVRRLAAVLLVPYVLWTAFATGLSWRLWQSNR